jgi:hypothetical protein
MSSGGINMPSLGVATGLFAICGAPIGPFIRR